MCVCVCCVKCVVCFVCACVVRQQKCGVSEIEVAGAAEWGEGRSDIGFPRETKDWIT